MTPSTPDQARHQPTRRAFLLLCAAAVVPRQRPIQVLEPMWWIPDPDAVYWSKQRIFYEGVYMWKYDYVTAFGETLANGRTMR